MRVVSVQKNVDMNVLDAMKHDGKYSKVVLCSIVSNGAAKNDTGSFVLQTLTMMRMK